MKLSKIIASLSIPLISVLLLTGCELGDYHVNALRVSDVKCKDVNPSLNKKKYDCSFTTMSAAGFTGMGRYVFEDYPIEDGEVIYRRVKKQNSSEISYHRAPNE